MRTLLKILLLQSALGIAVGGSVPWFVWAASPHIGTQALAEHSAAILVPVVIVLDVVLVLALIWRDKYFRRVAAHQGEAAHPRRGAAHRR